MSVFEQEHDGRPDEWDSWADDFTIGLGPDEPSDADREWWDAFGDEDPEEMDDSAADELAYYNGMRTYDPSSYAAYELHDAFLGHIDEH